MNHFIWLQHPDGIGTMSLLATVVVLVNRAENGGSIIVLSNGQHVNTLTPPEVVEGRVNAFYNEFLKKR